MAKSVWTGVRGRFQRERRESRMRTVWAPTWAARGLALAVVALLVPNAGGAQAPEGLRDAVSALIDLLGSEDPGGLEAFSDRWLAPSYLASLSRSGAVEHLRALRVAARGATADVRVEAEDDSLLLVMSGERRLTLRLQVDDEFRFETIAVAGDSPGDEQAEAVRRHLRAIEDLGSGTSDLDAFASSHLSSTFRDRLSEDELSTLLHRIRLAAARAGSVTVGRDGDDFVTVFGMGTSELVVTTRFEEEPPFLMGDLRVRDVVPHESGASPPPLTWSGLDEAFREAETAGFAGTVLAVRGGEAVLSESYGLADPATGRPNTAETIYDIGSIPIDFTRAAVLLLLQRGEIDLDDPVNRYFPDVPADKELMSLRQLLQGSSGLPNFHHLPGVDDDPDLTWMDRATAEHRILGARLLFRPGTGEAPSHSAFVLLAAMVERVSGKPYPDFLRVNFFEPAGMTSTGFYGDSLGYSAERFAVGGGDSPMGEPNIPPRWGATSWLIMGSGGMVSNPADLYRWFTSLRSGRILHGEALRLYLARGSAMGGTDRGFRFVHAWAGGDETIFVAQNHGAEGPSGVALLRGVIRLVEQTKEGSR